jgi:hypothetical protein
MKRLLSFLPSTASVPLALMVNAILAGSASAHVKWFCAYNIAGQPVGLENVLCPDFEFLAGLSVLALMCGCLAEGTFLGEAVLRAMDRATRYLRDNTELMFRAACGFFFVAIWAYGGILLTPELKTDSNIVGAIQLGIAAGVLSRRTMPLSAIGIVALFAIAIWQYGIFHLADYPVFLGIAGYLALIGFQRDFFGARPIDVVRWTAGVTLMWASIEKWAYPEWSFPLFVEHPTVTMGFDGEFFMRAAGVIEFTLAFSLLWTPLVRRISAIVLAAMFVAATFEFGKIDVIGHAPIVVVLLAIVGDDVVVVQRTRGFAATVAVAYCVALAGFLTAYYFVHAFLFGTQIL